MKKIILSLLLLSAVTFTSSAQFTLGAGAVYSFNGSSFGFQGNALIGLSEKLDLSPSISVFLESGTPVFADLDVHYDLLRIGDGFRIMPLAGLNLRTSGETAIGLNLGASIRFDINENTIYIEPKGTLLTYKGMVLSAGILF